MIGPPSTVSSHVNDVTVLLALDEQPLKAWQADFWVRNCPTKPTLTSTRGLQPMHIQNAEASTPTASGAIVAGVPATYQGTSP